MLMRMLGKARRKLQVLGGALAVLIMFFVPVTRAVLAQTTSTQADDPNNAAVDSDNTGVSSGTSDSGPTTPANPSPDSTGGSTSRSLNTTGPSHADVAYAAVPAPK